MTRSPIDPSAGPTLADYADLLTAPGPEDDKYSRGVLGMVTGSLDYPGAAVLTVEAALHTGVGMVRYRGPETVAHLVVQHRPEAVIIPGRITAMVVGSGCSELSEGDLIARLEGLVGPAGRSATDVPAVLDAGALGLRRVFRGPVLLTPHRGELERLQRAHGVSGDDPVEVARELATTLRATVIVKGSQTVVVSDSGAVTRCPVAPAWLATAGTGDVLAGVLGALVTVRQASAGPLTGGEMARLAVAGVLVHRQAALLAQRSPAGGAGPFTALALARAVSEVIASACSPG